MRIDLKYFLNKKKVSLIDFCNKNNLSTYEMLCNYCIKRNLIPVDLEFYNQCMPNKNTMPKKSNETQKKKPNTTRRPRKTSKVTKKRAASSKNNP